MDDDAKTTAFNHYWFQSIYVYGGEAIKSELNIQFFIPTQPYKLQISVSFPHDAF